MKIWRLDEKNSIIHIVSANTWEYNYALTRLSGKTIPYWLTRNPVPKDFEIWWGSLPSSRTEITADDLKFCDEDMWWEYYGIENERPGNDDRISKKGLSPEEEQNSHCEHIRLTNARASRRVSHIKSSRGVVRAISDDYVQCGP